MNHNTPQAIRHTPTRPCLIAFAFTLSLFAFAPLLIAQPADSDASPTTNTTPPPPPPPRPDHKFSDDAHTHTRGAGGISGRKGRDKHQQPDPFGSIAIDKQKRKNKSQSAGKFSEITAADRAAMLDVLRDFNPEIADRLESSRTSQVQGFGRAGREKSGTSPLPTFERMRYRLARLVQEKKDNPELYAFRVQDHKLESQTSDASRRYREATQADAKRSVLKKIRNELTDLIEQHFDVRQHIREAELKRFEDRIADLRDQLEKRQNDRKNVIKNRLDQLTGEDRTAW